MTMTASINQNIPVGYRQTEIGIIPVDWDVKEINDFTLSVALLGNQKLP